MNWALRRQYRHTTLSNSKLTRRTSQQPRRKKYRLGLKLLEDRSVPAVIAVTGDGDTIAADGLVTLREAITSVNAGANVNVDVVASGLYGVNETILFNIAGVPGTVHTIRPTSFLPTITRPVFINGYSQPGASPNTLADGDNAFLAIELDGSNAGNLAVGLFITAEGSTIQGLVINRFAGSGIFSDGGTVIRGNFIGTDQTGKLARGNGLDGVQLVSSNNTVGGLDPADRNLISGNDFVGIRITGKLATNNLIQGNFIGTDDTGEAALGNAGAGIFILIAVDSLVGGTSAGAGNRIAFNSDAGIKLPANIGGAAGHAFVGNLIFANGGLGVDFNDDGVTLNDNLDADAGPNALQNFPVLTSAIPGGGNTVIQGFMQGAANRSFYVEFFASPVGDVTEFGEGRTFLGALAFTANAQGTATFNFQAPTTLPAGSLVSAIATEVLVNNSSEFSPAIYVGTPNQKFVQELYEDVLGRAGDVNNPADAGSWVNHLASGTLSRAQVAAQIEGSTEARLRLVASWYGTYLGRSPQGNETAGWVSLLQQGFTEEQVASGILGSDEFFDRAQTLFGSDTANERFVTALYHFLLNRSPSAGEIEVWVNALPQIGRAGVAEGFLTSAEYRTGLFTGYYRTFLHRLPDADGLSAHVNNDLAELGVRLAFESSDEFYLVA